MPLDTGEYVAGLAYLLVTLGACAAAGAILVGRRAPHLRGLVRMLGRFLGFSAALVVVHLAPAALGVLSRPAVLVACALVLAGAVLIAPAAAGPPDLDAGAGDSPWSRRFAAAGGFAVAAAAAGFLAARADEPVTAVDAMMMYLPNAARWIQSGSLWQLVEYGPELVTATYPHNGVLTMIAGVLPWHSTFAIRYVDAPFLAAAALAVYAAGRELGAPRSTAVLAAAAFAALPTVARISLDLAQVDPPMWAWFGAGSLFLLRSARRSEPGELLLAGLGLGLAFGTKWYAVAYVPPLVVLWLLARRREAGLARALRASVPLVVPIALLGGFWLVRNWVLIGNPVFPGGVGLFGVTIFEPPPSRLHDLASHEVADYLLDGRIWRDWYVPAYADNFGASGPLLLLGGVAAGLVALRGRLGRPLLVAVAALVIGVLYTLLPTGAWGPEGRPFLVGPNARWLVPGLMAAAVLAAWLAAERPRLRLLVEVLLLAGILEGLSHWAPEATPRALAAGAAAVGALLLARRAIRAPRAALAAAAIAGAAVLGALLPDRGGPPGYRLGEAPIRVLLERVPGSGAVGLAKPWDLYGLAPALPAFGARLDNRVDFLGHRPDGTLVDWDEREGFQRQLRRGGYDAVLIGTGVPARPGGEEPQAGWARDLGYREVARSPRLVLLVR